MQNYEIGAYYFPNYHHDTRNDRWHGHGWNEWRLLKAAQPRFAGHNQPKVPLWGYEDEADPAVMAKKSTLRPITDFVLLSLIGIGTKMGRI